MNKADVPAWQFPAIILLASVFVAPISLFYSIAAFFILAFWLGRNSYIIGFAILATVIGYMSYGALFYKLPLFLSKQLWVYSFFEPDTDFTGLTGVLEGMRRDDASTSAISFYFSNMFHAKAMFLHILSGIIIGACAAFIYRIRSDNPLKSVSKAKTIKEKHSVLGEAAHSSINKRPSSYRDGSIVGSFKNGSPAILSDSDANMHTLILGSSGSGKTVTMCNIIESAILRDFPTIIIDGKGDRKLGKQIHQFAEKNGKESYSLSFGYENSNSVYDPFYCGNFTSKKDRIIGLREWESDHYEKLSAGFMQIVFKVLESLDVYPDLETLAEYMDKASLIKLIKERGLDDNADSATKELCQKLLKEVTEMNIEEKDIQSLIREIKNMAGSALGSDFYSLKSNDGKKVLRLTDVFEKDAVVYIGLPVFSAGEMSSVLGKLIINDLKAAIEDRQNSDSESKCYVFFDEFSVFSGKQVLNLVNMARGYGAHCVFSTQTLSDISSGSQKGNELVQQFIGNCRNYLVHAGVPSDDTSKIADQYGTKEATDYTAQIGATGTTGLGSARRTREYLVHPDKMKALKNREAYFIIKSEMGEFIKTRHSHISQETIN